MRLFLLTICCFCSLAAFSQADPDTLFKTKDTVKVHSVKKAMIFSAVLPGAGQVYNHIAMPKGQKKAFWKVPLIYAGLGATSYFLITNQAQVKSLKNEYNNRLASLPGDPQWENYDDQGVLTLFSQYQRNRDLSILGLSLVYLLQVADAGVEAHFVRFDVSRDLSMQIRPTLIPNGLSLLPTSGMSMQLDFKTRTNNLFTYSNKLFL